MLIKPVREDASGDYVTSYPRCEPCCDEDVSRRKNCLWAVLKKCAKQSFNPTIFAATHET